MSCTEVGEYMQRQLDDDLNEHELKILKEHTRNCRSCSALFERLTLLSGSLEQLPRVTPPISIVDSIMPELMKLDAIKDAKHKIRQKKRLRWMTSISSISAAAVIILIMVTIGGNQDKQISNNAALVPFGLEDTENQAGNEKSSNSVSMSSEYVKEEELEAYPATDKQLEIESLSTGKTAAEEDSAVPTSPTSQTDKSSESSDEPSEQHLPVPIVSSNPIDNGIAGVTSFPEVNIKPSVGEQTEGLPNEQEDNHRLSEQANELSGNESIFSVADQSNPNKFYSPDELVYLLFEEHTIALYNTSSGELLKAIDKPLDGEYTVHWWSKDHKNLQIHVLDSSGVEHILDFEI